MSLVTKEAEMLALGAVDAQGAGLLWSSGISAGAFQVPENRCPQRRERYYGTVRLPLPLGEGDRMSAVPIALVGRGESPSFISHNAAGGAPEIIRAHTATVSGQAPPPYGRSPSWRPSEAALMRGVR